MTKLIVAFRNFENQPKKTRTRTNVTRASYFSINKTAITTYVTRSEVFWYITQGSMVIPCRRFGTDILHCVVPQKIGDLIYIAAEAWNNAYTLGVFLMIKRIALLVVTHVRNDTFWYAVKENNTNVVCQNILYSHVTIFWIKTHFLCGEAGW
jgi:hypothetical protein